MDTLIQVNSGFVDTIIPSFIMATKLKNEGIDVAVFLEWKALVAFAERRFDFSPFVTKYAPTIEENARKMGLPVDPMNLLKSTKAAGVPIYGCAIEAVLSGITENVPPEVQLLDEPDISKPLLEAKKIIGGF